MPLTVITDPQLASYIGVPVGGLAIDQRTEGGGIIGFHGTPSDADTLPYTEAELNAIINALPTVGTLYAKLNILRSIMRVEGLGHGGADYSSDPGRHPRFGFLYDAYLSDELLGDALASVWPSTTTGVVYVTGVYEPGVYT